MPELIETKAETPKKDTEPSGAESTRPERVIKNQADTAPVARPNTAETYRVPDEEVRRLLEAARAESEDQAFIETGASGSTPATVIEKLVAEVETEESPLITEVQAAEPITLVETYEARAKAVFEAGDETLPAAQPVENIISEPFREPEITEADLPESLVPEAAVWTEEDLAFLESLAPPNEAQIEIEERILALELPWMPEPEQSETAVYASEVFSGEFELELIPIESETMAPTSETPVEVDEERLLVALESLEPERAEAVQPILSTIRQMTREIQELSEAEQAEREVLEQALQQWCGRLLEELDFKPDDQTLKHFTRLLIEREEAVNELSDEKLSIEILNRKGTREYKAFGRLKALSKLARDIKLYLPLWLGRYVSRLAATAD